MDSPELARELISQPGTYVKEHYWCSGSGALARNVGDRSYLVIRLRTRLGIRTLRIDAGYTSSLIGILTSSAA